ncbi:uncharacterized protein LOC119579083 [Penaeus monodon]|uniref:uncharacterized protein LOC119579083 n=1 Tax=Penaeus monodon TaxID=6687 RepID=UPI0018A6EB5A|nr:uncharacterized protein LOC119579083 [Penaeus monodon]
MASRRRFRRNALVVFFLCCSFFVLMNNGRMTSFGQNCYIPALASAFEYMEYINYKQTVCNNWVQLGGWLDAPDDGKKFLCLDERFRLDRNDCVVLSFGVNNEWSFEDDAERLGCKVYAFDPSMGARDHQRSHSIRFFSLGISDYQGDLYLGQLKDVRAKRGKSFPVDRYENIVRRLGLEGRVIDYVKMDIELAELDVLRDLLDNSPHLLRNINQIAVEIHHDLMEGRMRAGSNVQDFWTLFHRLECAGFRILYSHTASIWQEMVWSREIH